MNITDKILNFIIQRGLGGDIKNFKTTVEIPNQDAPPIKVTITADNIQIKVEKE